MSVSAVLFKARLFPVSNNPFLDIEPVRSSKRVVNKKYIKYHRKAKKPISNHSHLIQISFHTFLLNFCLRCFCFTQWIKNKSSYFVCVFLKLLLIQNDMVAMSSVWTAGHVCKRSKTFNSGLVIEL